MGLLGSIFKGAGKGSGKPSLGTAAKETAKRMIGSFSFSSSNKQKAKKEPFIKTLAKSLIKPPERDPSVDIVRLEEIKKTDTTQSILLKIHKMMVRTFDFKERYFDSLYRFHEERVLEENRNHDEIMGVLAMRNLKPLPRVEPAEEEIKIGDVIQKITKKKSKGKSKRVSRGGGKRTSKRVKPVKPPKAPATPPKNPSPAAPPKPTAERVPAGPPKYDGFSSGQVAAMISAHEGGVNSVYGDVPDPTTKTLKNRYGLRPEEWSAKYLQKEKPLTDFTLGEVLEYQKYRLKASGKSTGAVGSAQFMPTTLFGPKLDGSTGLVRDSGLSMDTKFTKETQELLTDVMYGKQDEVLKAYGVTNITPAIKLMANYLGAYGAVLVMRAAQTEPNRTVSDVIMNGTSGLRGTGYDPTEGGAVNPTLNTTTVRNFITSKEKFINEQIQKFQFERQTKDTVPTPAAAPAGTVTTEKLAMSTIENKDVRKFLEEQQKKDMTQMFNNISVNTNNSSTGPTRMPVNDRPAFEIKRDGNGYITQTTR